jgi:EAL domain-containing protein (putative c-di-GMP-specific phosphodiesterase class I)
MSIPFAPLRERAPSIAHLIETDGLRAWFQPIVRLGSARVHAHEALIRGPQGSALHMPDALFAAARTQGLEIDLEIACARAALRRWAELAAPGTGAVGRRARAHRA